jgi:hypothetical protein
LRIKDFAGPVDTPQVPVRAAGDSGLSRVGAECRRRDAMKIVKFLCGGLLALAFVSEAPATETTTPDEMVRIVNEAGGDASAMPGMAGDAAAAEIAAVEPIAADSATDAVADSAPDSLVEVVEEAPAELPAAPDPGMAASEPVSQPRALGQVGYDSEGRPGRIHVVVRGDTLWDISDAYLGTPWVWPSIWTDNRNIENPHRIHPDERIWITDSEMRVVSREEADAMLNASPPGDDFPADQIDSAEATPVDSPVEAPFVPAERVTRRVSVREWVGLISSEELDAAASVVERVPLQQMLAQLDQVYIGLGEGDVQVGDQFDIVRKDAKVFDPATKRLLGHHVRALGWLEVVEVHGETSLATIGLSMEDIWLEDKLLPRRPESLDITIQDSPEDVSGEIVFFPQRRVVIGPLDFVYLNRGTLDGLEAGSPLQVVRGGTLVKEKVRGVMVEVPKRVVATLLVVDAQPETAVALVAETETDLLVGDIFRGGAP